MCEAVKSRRNAADTLDLFLNAFSARDIAEAMPSFDHATPVDVICREMDAGAVEVAGIRRSGFIVAWLTAEDIATDRQLPARPFDSTAIIAEPTPLHVVVQRLNASSYLFVQSFGQICGYVRRSDLLKPAVRMWLFGLVTITELRMTKLIDEMLPEDSWRIYLSAGRLPMAAELQRQRGSRHHHYRLLDCLQFADKARIISRHEALRDLTRFGSKRSAEEFAKEFQSLRNSLAHSQDILNDWRIIVDLATNLQRFVLGPALSGS